MGLFSFFADMLGAGHVDTGPDITPCFNINGSPVQDMSQPIQFLDFDSAATTTGSFSTIDSFSTCDSFDSCGGFDSFS
jgi:hypothetical protein